MVVKNLIARVSNITDEIEDRIRGAIRLLSLVTTDIMNHHRTRIG